MVQKEIKIWKSIKVKLKNIKFDGDNPNRMNDEEIKRLNKSMKEFGFTQDIVVDKNSMILADGEHRLKELIKEGIEEAEVKLVEFTDDTHRRAYRQAANKIHGIHDKDLDAREYLKIIEGGKKDLLKMTTGLNLAEVKKHLRQRDLLGKEEEFDVKDELGAIKEPVTKLGDIWELGKHRLMCGDSTKEEDVSNIMNGELGTMIFTDPPYNISYKSFGFRKGEFNSYSEGKYQHKEVFNDNLKPDDYQKFLSEVVKNGFKFTKEKSAIFFWNGDKNLYLAYLALINNKYKIHQLCSWVKNTHVFAPGCLFHKIMEFCVIGFKEGHKPDHNKDFLKCHNNLFEIEFDNFLEHMNAWYMKRDTTQNYEHPTQKPKELTYPAINAVTVFDDIIIDFFGGSGSTLIAAEQTGRRCFMMELDPFYCDVIIKRYEKFTEQKAKLLNNTN